MDSRWQIQRSQFLRSTICTVRFPLGSSSNDRSIDSSVDSSINSSIDSVPKCNIDVRTAVDIELRMDKHRGVMLSPPVPLESRAKLSEILDTFSSGQFIIEIAKKMLYYARLLPFFYCQSDISNN